MPLHSADLDTLVTYSRKLGETPSMIQAAGGNTSVKADGTMWIKASGRWLGEINDPSGFVEMDVDRILALLDDPALDRCRYACLPVRCLDNCAPLGRGANACRHTLSLCRSQP